MVVAFVVYEWREFHPQPKEVIATQEVRRIEPTPEPEEKTIVVHGYFRKDGVYVKEHIRHVK